VHKFLFKNLPLGDALSWTLTRVKLTSIGVRDPPAPGAESSMFWKTIWPRPLSACALMLVDT
jgi:hypothetical protein